MPMFSFLKNSIRKLKLRSKAPEQIFSEYAKKNKWRGDASLSGKGSSLDATADIRIILPKLCSELKVKSLLDLPCGDFHWMSQVDLNGIDYLGGDIVADLIKKNQDAHGNMNINFTQLDLIKDAIPTKDLILTRDCLVHLCNKHIFLALYNIATSGSNWLLTTTFPDIKQNKDILTGDWRAINLTLPPYSLPEPTMLINEGQSWVKGQIPGKSLGLWEIKHIREAMIISQ